MYCHPANNVLQYDGAYWIRTNKAMPLRVLAHQCHLTLMPQIKYGELPRVLLLHRMHSAFLAVRGLVTISILSSEFAAPLNGLANPSSFGLHRLPLTLQISFQNTIIETHCLLPCPHCLLPCSTLFGPEIRRTMCLRQYASIMILPY
jgi:hypothetical protein